MAVYVLVAAIWSPTTGAASAPVLAVAAIFAAMVATTALVLSIVLVVGG